MVYADNLLKFTKYPFSYSLTGILLGTAGITFDTNQIVFIAVAGSIGTLLTFWDPYRIIVENRATYRIKNSKTDRTTAAYHTSSLESRPISFELEKITGLFYFFTIIIIFLIVMGLSLYFPMTIIDNLAIKNLQDETICDKTCILPPAIIGVGFFLFIIGLVATKYWRELDNRIMLAGYLREAIDSKYSTRNSVENMNRAVEQRDWNLAKYWMQKIQDEIKIKAGKREIILKSLDTVYRPLYRESNIIKDKLIQMTDEYNFDKLPVDEWQKIKNDAKHIALEEQRDSKAIENFYDKVSKYNRLLKTCFDKAEKYLLEMSGTRYAGNTKQIRFWYTVPTGAEEFALVNLLLHEKDITELPSYRRVHKLEIIYNQQNKDAHLEYDKQVDFDEFCRQFETVFVKIQQDLNIQEFKKLFVELKKNVHDEIIRCESMLELESKL